MLDIWDRQGEPQSESEMRGRMYYETTRARFYSHLLDNDCPVSPDLIDVYLANLKGRFTFLATSFLEGKLSESAYRKTQLAPTVPLDDAESSWEIQLMRQLIHSVHTHEYTANPFYDFDRWRQQEQSIPPVERFIFSRPEDVQESELGLSLFSRGEVFGLGKTLAPYFHSMRDRFGGVCVLSNFASGLSDAGFVAHWARQLHPSQVVVRYSPAKEGDRGLWVPAAEKQTVEVAQQSGHPFFFVDHFTTSGSTVDAFFNWLGPDTPGYCFISYSMMDDQIDRLAQMHGAEVIVGEPALPFVLFARE